MSLRALEMGIKAVQMGSRAEGARLLRYALKQDGRSATLDGDQRATGYVWLAETTDDPESKRRYYAAAVQHVRDPGLSVEVRARLNALAASPSSVMPSALPPASFPPEEAVPAGNVNVALMVARVLDGAHGAGTAVFVDGMWVTTRHVVGGAERLTVELHQHGQMAAAVAASSPDHDLALLIVGHTPPGALTTAALREDRETSLIALAFDGTVTQGAYRPTRRTMAAHWLPTDITALPDAGGDPLFDDANRLVGIMTLNTARSADHLFAVRVEAARSLIAAYRQSGGAGLYCPSCGYRSAALAAGYAYCERCGAVGTTAPATRRSLPGSDQPYRVGGAPCATCGAAAGSCKGRCLRCGGAV
jgi:hypothetical protein